MKRKILTVSSVILLILILPLTVIIFGFCLPPQFGNTYYAVLPKMYGKLKAAENKKIVIIGTSSVAFGVDGALLEKELEECGYDYTVCNFGLYGALGTKLMIDLCRGHIGEGDIVVFAPELNAQTLSLYFSGREAWYAADGDFGMLDDIENSAEMVGSFTAYTSEKFKAAVNGKPDGSGIYSAESFDENCDLKNYPREYNKMSGGFDPDNLIDFDFKVSDEFAKYVSEFRNDVIKAGGEIYWCMPPVNCLAVKNGDLLGDFADDVSARFGAEILGNPYDALLDAEWFYDSNFHLNSAGATVNTARLAEGLKTKLGCTAVSGIKIPPKPPLPDGDGIKNGDNSDADCFLYERREGALSVVGLSENGLKRSALTVPCAVNGVAVKYIDAGAFGKNEVLEEVVIQSNVIRLRDGLFEGCRALKRIYLKNPVPSSIGVGFGLMNGLDGCKIYVPADSYQAYAGDYFWGHYVESIVKIA